MKYANLACFFCTQLTKICVCVEDVTCPRVDMNFIFQWSTRYLTSERLINHIGCSHANSTLAFKSLRNYHAIQLPRNADRWALCSF